MGSVNKKSPNKIFLSIAEVWNKNTRRPFQYLKAFWHVLLRIQPFLSIFFALLITVPLGFLVSYAINIPYNNHIKNTYVEGVIGNIPFIDPLPQIPSDKPFSQLNRDVTNLLFDPLFSSDSQGNLVGVLADSYVAKENGLKVDVKLKDRNWSNGKKVDANDVISTFNTIKNIGASCLYYAAIDGIKADIIDEQNVEFTLDTPNSAFTETLAWPILPATDLEVKYSSLVGGKFGKYPTSNTDWTVDNFSENSITLKNTSNKYLKLTSYNNNSELEDALNAGYIDGYYSLDKPKAGKTDKIYEYPLLRQLYSLYFNFGDNGSSTTKDPIIRKAIFYAINRNDVVADFGMPQKSVIDENSWAYNPNINTYSFDLQKSEDLLNTAGYPRNGDYHQINGRDIEFTLSIPDISSRKILAEKIQKDLKVAGIKMNIKAIKDTDIIDNTLQKNLFYKFVVVPKNFEAMIYSVDSGMDPDKFSQWHSSKIPNLDKGIGGLNFSGYSNFRVDEYLRQGRTLYDQNARKTPYSQFQKVFYDEAPVYTLYNPYLFYVTSSKIKIVDFSSAIKIEDRFDNFNKWEF